MREIISEATRLRDRLAYDLIVGKFPDMDVYSHIQHAICNIDKAISNPSRYNYFMEIAEYHINMAKMHAKAEVL